MALQIRAYSLPDSWLASPEIVQNKKRANSWRVARVPSFSPYFYWGFYQLVQDGGNLVCLSRV